ncbi:hypothetical protein D9M71_598770 [compost metagenome]
MCWNLGGGAISAGLYGLGTAAVFLAHPAWRGGRAGLSVGTALLLQVVSQRQTQPALGGNLSGRHRWSADLWTAADLCGGEVELACGVLRAWRGQHRVDGAVGLLRCRRNGR